MKLHEHCYHNLISSHMLDSQVRAVLSWGIAKGFILQRVELGKDLLPTPLPPLINSFFKEP